MKNLEFFRENLDLLEVQNTLQKMAKERRPLYNVNYSLYNEILDLLEELEEEQDPEELIWEL